MKYPFGLLVLVGFLIMNSDLSGAEIDGDGTITKAFEQGEATLLDPLFLSNEKILFEAAPFSIQRHYYSKEQCLQQLTGIFSTIKTMKFQLAPSSEGPHRRARWTFQRKTTSIIESVTIYFEIVKTQTDVHLVSIRISAVNRPQASESR